MKTAPNRTETDRTAPLLGPAAAAALLGISIRTLHRWEQNGWVTPVRTTGGHRRYHRADLDTLAARRAR